VSQVNLTFKDEHTFKVDCGPRDTGHCRSIPGLVAGKLDTRQGDVEWTCVASWWHANVLRSVFGSRLTYGPEVIAWGEEQTQKEADRTAVRHTIPSPICDMMRLWED
jgi:hypothetical protein